ncbi:MAG: HAD family hydrolase [Promethearchaeota archaeon]
MGKKHISQLTEKIEAIIFDFDFTIADSSKGVEKCISYALRMLDLSIPSVNEMHKTIGLSLEETFLKLAGEQYSSKTHTFIQFFIEKADEIMSDFTYVFKDIHKVMDLLKEHGFILGIVSTKFRYRIESILKREKILDYFKVIIGGEDVVKHKPDPEGLLLAIKKINSSPSKILYIGDSLVDAETAKRAAVTFIPVLSGTTLLESFKSNEISGFLNNMTELPSLLRIRGI